MGLGYTRARREWGRSNVHVDFSGKECAGGRVD